jgi:hypothetical protein
MKINTGQRTGRANKPLNWPTWFMGLTGVLAGALFFTMLFNPEQAFSAAAPAGQDVTLAWDQSTDPIVAGYSIYYGGTSRAYTDKISVGLATNATIPNLVGGATYYFAATTYSVLGIESLFSSEVAYTVPIALGVRLRVTPARQFIVTVAGPAGHAYQIQASQNLKTWAAVGSVTVGAGDSFDFTDTNAANFSQRFYRIKDMQP